MAPRVRKPRTEEQREKRRAENEKHRIANDTEEQRAKRQKINERRRVGGDLHKKPTPEARKKKITKLFNKRHEANPEMRTNAPRRKFKNQRASWTNVDDVYQLRYDSKKQAQALEAMTQRAEAAEARAEAEKGAREAAEARAEAAEAQIKAAGACAERAKKKRRGIALTVYENFLEAQAGEALEAERQTRAQVESELAEARAADAQFRDWFEEAGLAELTRRCKKLPTRNQLAQFFQNA